MRDVMQMVTSKIIAKLETGTVPWRKPWICPGKGAYNRASGHPYSLLNQLMLEHSGEYATYNQWTKQLGGKIRRGERAETVVFWKWPETEESVNSTEAAAEKTEVEKRSKYPVLRHYHVFHISQVEGVDPLEPVGVPATVVPIDIVEKIFKAYVEREGIRCDIGSYPDAYYAPSQDLIHVPGIWLYKRPEPYYGTLLHEAVHSTGIPGRLNRAGLMDPKFGSETYSREELVAEIGSMALLAHAGIQTDECFESSAGYIAGWLATLKSDQRMVAVAAGQAEKALKYILNPSAEKRADE